MNRTLTTMSIAGVLLAAMALPSAGAFAQGRAEILLQHANQPQILYNLDSQRVQLVQQINNLQSSGQISRGTASNLLNDLYNEYARESNDVNSDNLNFAEVQSMVNDLGNVQNQVSAYSANIMTNYNNNNKYSNQWARNNGNRHFNRGHGNYVNNNRRF